MTPLTERMFVSAFAITQMDAHQTALEKGWWNKPVREDGTCLMLMVTELSEACEALRHGNPNSDVLIEYNDEPVTITQAEEELADVIIRIMDFAEKKGLSNLGTAIIMKMQFNQTRPHKHGKLF